VRVQDIEPRFDDIEGRLTALEADSHTHDDGQPDQRIPTPHRSQRNSTAGEAAEEASTFPTAKKADAHAGLKADIQADIKVYDAGVVGQALMNQVALRNGNNDFCRHEAFVMRTGETTRVQPFVLTDALYDVPTEDMLKRVLATTDIDKIKWVAEKMDCEKIAREFVDACAELGLTDAVGRIFAASGNHAFIVALVQDGEDVKVVFIEPQNDEFVEPISLKDKAAITAYLSEGGDKDQLKYNIYNALMVVS